MEESKILIANYPNPLQHPSFVNENDRSKTLEVICGYDTQINSHEVTLQIARDLITALLTFDRIYIQGNNVWDDAGMGKYICKRTFTPTHPMYNPRSRIKSCYAQLRER